MKFKFSKPVKLLLILTALSATGLIISNLAATKLWDFCGISVDGGLVIFPILYVTSDLIVEFYGEKTGRWTVLMGMLTMLMATIVFSIVNVLPAFPEWENQAEYNLILGSAQRVMIGSLLGYGVSQLFGNFLFVKIKQKTGQQGFWLRLMGSSVASRILDTAIFQTVAFLGILPFSDFLAQAVFAYVLSIVLDAVFIPFSYWMRAVARRYLGKEIKQLL